MIEERVRRTGVECHNFHFYYSLIRSWVGLREFRYRLTICSSVSVRIVEAEGVQTPAFVCKERQARHARTAPTDGLADKRLRIHAVGRRPRGQAAFRLQKTLTAGWKVQRMVSSMKLHLARYTSRAFVECAANRTWSCTRCRHTRQHVRVHIGGLLGDGQRHGGRLVEHEKAQFGTQEPSPWKSCLHTGRGLRCPSTLVCTSSPEKRSSPVRVVLEDGNVVFARQLTYTFLLFQA